MLELGQNNPSDRPACLFEMFLDSPRVTNMECASGLVDNELISDRDSTGSYWGCPMSQNYSQ